MPAKRPPTPEEMFGFGAVPLASYFGLPEGGSQNTMFSPEARGMIQQGEQYQRAQQAQEAEDIANEMLGQAGGMTDEEINQQILQNPRLLGTQAGQQAQQFQQFRQQVAPSQADEVLGPVYAAKIKDPRLLARFQSRMVNQGMSANDAFEEYRREEHNDQAASELAKFGVPPNEVSTLLDDYGYVDPVRKAQRLAQAEIENKRAERLAEAQAKYDPVSSEMKHLEGQIKMAQKTYSAEPSRLEADLDYQRQLARYKELARMKESQFNPPSAAAGQIQTVSGTPSAFLQRLSSVMAIPVKAK